MGSWTAILGSCPCAILSHPSWKGLLSTQLAFPMEMHSVIPTLLLAYLGRGLLRTSLASCSQETVKWVLCGLIGQVRCAFWVTVSAVIP